MDRIHYLFDLADNGKLHEIKSTWSALGELKVNKNTKLYTKDTLFLVDEKTNKGLDGCLVYCLTNYKVGPNNGQVFWSTYNSDNISKLVVTEDVAASPAFIVVLEKDEWDSLASVDPDPDYIPFPFEEVKVFQQPITTDIQISDSYLNMALSEVGIPFVRFDEVEYSREQICELCVKRAFLEYYRFFPIEKHVNMGNFGAGSISFPLDKNVIKVIDAQFRGGGASSVTGPKGAFAFLNEQYQTYGLAGGNPKWGRGLRYNKRVPGFTGRAGGTAISNAMLGRAAAQAVQNYQKRTTFYIELDDNGNKIAKGYSNIGGELETVLGYWHPNFEMIVINNFDEVVNVLKLITAWTMRSLRPLRHLIKSDTPGEIDFSDYSNRAGELEKEVTEHWYNHPRNKAVLMRGQA